MSNRAISAQSLNFIKNNMDTICRTIRPCYLSSIFDKQSANYLKDAYNALDLTLDGWRFMREETPPDNKGYTFWKHEILSRIEVNMKYINVHNRASFGCTMRDMEFIAKNSWELFINRRIQYILTHEDKDKNIYLNNILNLMGKNEDTNENSLENVVNNVSEIIEEVAREIDENPESNGLEVMANVFEATSIADDREQQADAMRQFSRGEMDYATMRSFCG